MNNPNEIIIHCSDTRTNQSFSIDEVRRWHTNPPPNGNGWNDVGYHFYITLKGSLQHGRNLYTNGAHCVGHNDQIGVCFEGGKNPDGSHWNGPTKEQLDTWYILKQSLIVSFGKNFKISPHNYYSEKTCPNFDTSIL